MDAPPTVSPEEWEAAREELLVKEKELTRRPRRAGGPAPPDAPDGRREGLSLRGPRGSVSLLDLFEGRRQLIVYRAFYAPDVTTTVRLAPPTRSGPASAARWSPIRCRIQLI